MTRLWWLPFVLLTDCAQQRIEMRPVANSGPPPYQCITQARGVANCTPQPPPATAMPEITITPVPVFDFRVGS